MDGARPSSSAAALGILWTLVWLLLYRDPARHPRVNPAQLQRLQSAQPAAAAGGAIPWRSLFSHRTVWGMMLGFFCLNFVLYFFITWFPSYLMNVRGFSLRQLGSLGMLPPLASIPVEWLGGWTSDTLHRRGWSLTAARKSCIVVGLLCSSLDLAAPHSPAESRPH